MLNNTLTFSLRRSAASSGYGFSTLDTVSLGLTLGTSLRFLILLTYAPCILGRTIRTRHGPFYFGRGDIHKSIFAKL